MNNICKQIQIQIGIKVQEKDDLFRIQGDLKDEYALKKDNYHFKFFGNLTPEQLDGVIIAYDNIIQSKENDIEKLQKQFTEAGCSL